MFQRVISVITTTMTQTQKTVYKPIVVYKFYTINALSTYMRALCK
jgi:hypothetical protein